MNFAHNIVISRMPHTVFGEAVHCG